MYDKIARLGIDKSILPIVTSENEVVGHCRGIPVSVPIGDNQASFLGATKSNNDALLVNFGTGSQISSACDFCTVDGDIELRPYVDGKYLLVGSALSGGYSYSLLEAFFRSYAQALGASGAQYEIMNELAAQAYEKGEKELLVDTAFLGKRSDPSARGSVKMIGKDNFTPSALILGVLRGMVSELYGLYARFPKKQGVLVASGGAVKKNELLRRIIEDTFQMSLTVSDVNEDAACGAAIFSLQNKNTI